MSDEGPYRKERLFVEKEELKRELGKAEKKLKKELSNLNILWIIAAALFFTVFVSFDWSVERLIIRQNEHYRQILLQQISPAECFLRYEYIVKQQKRATACAEMCTNYLNINYKTASEHDYDGLESCRVCLASVARPIPFEIVNASCQPRRFR